MESLNFFSEIGRLKDLPRTGWVIRGVSNPESVSDHSFRMALMALAYANELGLDSSKCVKLALVHDIHEIYTGDIATRADEKDQTVSKEAKKRIEKEAFERLMQMHVHNRGEIISLWMEYEEKKTEESKFVGDLDKIEMVLQALDYKRGKRMRDDLEEHFRTSGPAMTTEKGKQLWKKISDDYFGPKESF